MPKIFYFFPFLVLSVLIVAICHDQDQKKKIAEKEPDIVNVTGTDSNSNTRKLIKA
ncbi:hypothetical protein [Flavobacterium cerinum]|uniref:Efflux RND transporter periplasmic adaptor subunit n=1 Tax=Flavobacterium cerinum TaxID=2502784 RepID=A0ABY5IUM2_9FLAO|nr:hypothetical protein [Flavobacterium cerinum]UUC46010.1 hypothetical protein NOX80_02115 [Flavobacterium cerinum]